MKTPRYKIGDTVWFMGGATPSHDVITGLYVCEVCGEETWFYFFGNLGGWARIVYKFKTFWAEFEERGDPRTRPAIPEGALFPSKEALIQSL